MNEQNTPVADTDLHAAILNLPNNDLYDWGKCNARLTYRDGYEKAQNDAATLVLPLVERCKELEQLIMDCAHCPNEGAENAAFEALMQEAECLYAKIEKGEQ